MTISSACLQGTERTTYSKQDTTTRSTERNTGTRFPIIKTSVACVMSSLSEETMPELCATVDQRRDAGVLGPPPLRTVETQGSFPLVQYPRWFESTFWSQVAVGPLSLRDASPGSESSPPGRFSVRRPCTRSAIVRWQEATDPQSSEGGSQRACPTKGAHPTTSGRREGKQSALLGS